MYVEERKNYVFPRLLILSFIYLVPLVFPGGAWAVQQHGGTEGLVAHQIGHLLFIAGMVYLLYRLHISSPKGSGWFSFRIFIWLIISWNVLTFYGHWHMELIDHSKMLGTNGRTTGFTVSEPLDIMFYFSRLDHILLVPAFLFLLTALIRWRKQS